MGTRGRQRALWQRTRQGGRAGRQAQGEAAGRTRGGGRRERRGVGDRAGKWGPTASPTALRLPPLLRSLPFSALAPSSSSSSSSLPSSSAPSSSLIQVFASVSVRASRRPSALSSALTLTRSHAHTITTHCASPSSPLSRVPCSSSSLPRSLPRSLACLLGDSGNGGSRTAVRGGGSRKRKRNGHGKRQGHPPSPRCPRPAVLAPPSYRAGRRAQPFRTFSPAPLRPRTPRCLVRAHACGSARYHCALSPFIAPTLSDPDLRLLVPARTPRTFATP